MTKRKKEFIDSIVYPYTLVLFKGHEDIVPKDTLVIEVNGNTHSIVINDKSQMRGFLKILKASSDERIKALVTGLIGK